jgi:hypothetical protein
MPVKVLSGVFDPPPAQLAVPWVYLAAISTVALAGVAHPRWWSSVPPAALPWRSSESWDATISRASNLSSNPYSGSG